MFVIDDVLVSEELRDIRFQCDLERCGGACCVEGDAGAPLEEQEIAFLEDEIDNIIPYMRSEGVEIISNYGVFDYDISGEYVTPLINGRDCVFVYYENNIAKCAIEKAFDEGKIKFKKPLSCHLYPVRITKHDDFEAVNYHKWYICQSACTLGKKLDMPLYIFLKEPLIRKYGAEWYEKLVAVIEKKQKK